MKHIRRLTCFMLALLLMLSMAACDNGKPPVQSGPPASSGNAEDPGTPNTPDDPVGPDTPDDPVIPDDPGGPEAAPAEERIAQIEPIVETFINGITRSVYFGEDIDLTVGTVCDQSVTEEEAETVFTFNFGSLGYYGMTGTASVSDMRSNIEYIIAKTEYEQQIVQKCYPLTREIELRSSAGNYHYSIATVDGQLV